MESEKTQCSLQEFEIINLTLDLILCACSTKDINRESYSDDIRFVLEPSIHKQGDWFSGIQFLQGKTLVDRSFIRVWDSTKKKTLLSLVERFIDIINNGKNSERDKDF